MTLVYLHSPVTAANTYMFKYCANKPPRHLYDSVTITSILLSCVYRLPDAASSVILWHQMCICTDKFIVICNERGNWLNDVLQCRFFHNTTAGHTK